MFVGTISEKHSVKVNNKINQQRSAPIKPLLVGGPLSQSSSHYKNLVYYAPNIEK